MSTHLSRRMGDDQIKRSLSNVLGRCEVERQRVEEEYAAKWNAEKRRQAIKNNDALPDGSFPIVDQEDMDSAASLLGNTTKPRATVVAHMRKQARKHGLTLPNSLRSDSSSS